MAPSFCEELFQVAGYGATKDEAKQKAQSDADAACRKLNQGCDTAQQVGEGKFIESQGTVSYIANYVCAGTEAG